MKKVTRRDIKLGFLFSGRQGAIYEVTNFVFTNATTRKNGKDIPVEEIEVNVYYSQSSGKLLLKDKMKLMATSELLPLKIDLRILELLGFQIEARRNSQRLFYKNLYFDNLNESNGICILKNDKTGRQYLVSSIHEIQHLMI